MILAAMASFVAAAETPDERQPIEDLVTLRTAWKRGEAAGRECKTIALVSHVVSSRENYYVLVRPTTPGGAGVLALFPEEDVFERGDIVAIEGVAVEIMHHAGIKVTKAEKIRQMTLNEANGFKPPDFRRGILHARRIAAVGEINDVNFSNGITTFNLFSGKNSFVCRMKGELSQEKIGVKNVRVTGCALNHYGESSDLFEPILDIAGDEDIEIPAPRDYRNEAIIALSAILVLVMGALLLLWARQRRERHAARAVAAERRRMATDLHDTIEQYLAGVKILLTAASDPASSPENTRAKIAQAEDMLVYAKNEVRLAVMDLRQDGEQKSLKQALGEIADGVKRSGAVKVRLALRALPANLPPGDIQNLLMIVREAVTNALKHGKAKNIAIVSDPIEVSHRGGQGFALRVLNDGEPFEREKALGPQTGHFGLAGMEERAHKSGFDLSFGMEGRWTCVRLEVKQ